MPHGRIVWLIIDAWNDFKYNVKCLSVIGSRFRVPPSQTKSTLQTPATNYQPAVPSIWGVDWQSRSPGEEDESIAEYRGEGSMGFTNQSGKQHTEICMYLPNQWEWTQASPQHRPHIEYGYHNPTWYPPTWLKHIKETLSENYSSASVFLCYVKLSLEQF